MKTTWKARVSDQTDVRCISEVLFLASDYFKSVLVIRFYINLIAKKSTTPFHHQLKARRTLEPKLHTCNNTF